MTDETGRLHVLMERVIAAKEQLDAHEDAALRVRPRPPASFERLVPVRALFEARRLAMPRDYERVLRAHDGVDHLWCDARGASISLFGHRELLAQRGGAEVRIAAGAGGEDVALVPGPTELPVVVVRNAQGRAVARFPSVTAWLEWLLGEMTALRSRDRPQAVRDLARRELHGL
jgi:hypothetical protein